LELLLVREPIFDREGELFGYELRHSVGYSNGGAPAVEDVSSTTELVHDLLESHLTEVTSGKPAFVRATATMVSEGLLQLLPRNRVVVQIPASFAERADLLISCRQLFREGFRFAIDDFVVGPGSDRMVELSRYIRIDATKTAAASIAAGLEVAKEMNRPAIATGIETVERWHECKDLGFDYFQGRFFKSQDRMAVKGTPPAQSIHILRLLRLARDPGNSNRELADAIKADPTLTFKLLRLVNSAAMGGRGIDSIGHAIQILGRIPMQRWLTVLMVATMRGQGGFDNELATTALTRGRFLEQLAAASGGEIDEEHSFLVGLFSVMDTLVKLPLEEVIESAGLPTIVEEALITREGLFGTCLALLENYEEGDWPGVSRISKDLPTRDFDLSTAYSESVSWARTQLTV
jgi:EAL and modified HD-GYP domain-containing signal transduction protein